MTLELLWTKQGMGPLERHYTEALYDIVPSFQCAAGVGEGVLVVLRSYFFVKDFRREYEVYASGCRLEYGKKKTFIASGPETKELITALYLLSELLKEAGEKDKKGASIRVLICSSAEISEKLIESRFGSMKYLLAYLAKQAIGKDGELSEEMQYLEKISVEVVYG
jgi:hypothetical protein